MKIVLQAIKALLRKIENGLSDLRTKVQKAQETATEAKQRIVDVECGCYDDYKRIGKLTFYPYSYVSRSTVPAVFAYEDGQVELYIPQKFYKVPTNLIFNPYLGGRSLPVPVGDSIGYSDATTRVDGLYEYLQNRDAPHTVWVRIDISNVDALVPGALVYRDGFVHVRANFYDPDGGQYECIMNQIGAMSDDFMPYDLTITRIL